MYVLHLKPRGRHGLGPSMGCIGLDVDLSMYGWTGIRADYPNSAIFYCPAKLHFGRISYPCWVRYLQFLLCLSQYSSKMSRTIVQFIIISSALAPADHKTMTVLFDFEPLSPLT